MAKQTQHPLPVPGRRSDPASSVSLTGIELDTYRVYRDQEQHGTAAYEQTPFTMRDLLYMLFRHKKKIVFTFIAFSCLTIFYVQDVTDTYESEARVMIGNYRNPTAVQASDSGGSLIAQSRGGLGDFMRSEMAILSGRNVAESVVDRLGAEYVLKPPPGLEIAAQADSEASTESSEFITLAIDGVMSTIKGPVNAAIEYLKLEAKDLTVRERAILTVMKRTEAEPTTIGGSVMSITYEGQTPEIAQAVLAETVAAYEESNLKSRAGRLSPDYIQGRVAEIRDELQTKEIELQNRRKELNVADLTSERGLRLGQIATLDTQLMESNVEISALEAQLRILELAIEENGGDPTSDGLQIAADPSLDGLRARLNEFRAEEIDLSARYTDQARPLIEVKEKIAKLVVLLGGEAAAGSAAPVGAGVGRENFELATQRRTVVGDLEATHARVGALKKELAGLRLGVETLNLHERELEGLNREVDALQSQYEQYLSTANTSQIEAELTERKLSNIRIVQPASLPIQSEKSQRKMLIFLMFGVCMGLGLGAGMALTLDFFDHSLHNNEDVENNVGLPVLAAIPMTRFHRPETREEPA